VDTHRTGLEISSADPIREYLPEEERKLTANLLALARRVHEGTFSSARVGRELLCDLHGAIFQGVRNHAGRPRARGYGSEYLVFGPHRSAQRDEVGARLDAQLALAERSVRSLLENQDHPEFVSSSIHAALWTHAEVIRIHPFEDGNGRSSRMLLNAILVRLGLRPISFDVPKDEYISCLNHYFLADEIQPLIDLALRLYPLQ
jgi:fido (protein-threonine AMPylation protein)